MNIKDVVKTLHSIHTLNEVADALDVPHKNLVYHLYVVPSEKRYRAFQIRKRSGGTRTIYAPKSNIKFIQRKLADVLQATYKVKPCVHGYVTGKSIKTNALIHSGKRIILNIDLKDFFPSINFGRVRGLFKAAPFNCSEQVATILAQTCCHNGILPQGAPTSPIISNYICFRLDRQLSKLASRYKMHYTRYADDLTFSTNLRRIPPEIATINNHIPTLSEKLISIIRDNGFAVNESKIRYADTCNRQEVTGLVVNSGPNVFRSYVREIRAMLHAWEKFGIEAASREHFSVPSGIAVTERQKSAFINKVTGKVCYLGYIKGRENSVYANIEKRLRKLVRKTLPPDPEMLLDVPWSTLAKHMDMELPFVYCEGKSDRFHLEAALNWFHRRNLFQDLHINFFPYGKDEQMNNQLLLQHCRALSRTLHKYKGVICLFDSDVRRINKKVADKGSAYKYWGNYVYSALLPAFPEGKSDEICIEHYYMPEDLIRKDKSGRRLFLSTEFDPANGRHKSEPFIYSHKDRLRSDRPQIIDSGVISVDTGNNMALSKYQFALEVFNGKGNFEGISFENFRTVFDMLYEIVNKINNDTH